MSYYPRNMSDAAQPSQPELQFRKAEIAGAAPTGPRCAACKTPIEKTYFHAAGHTVCPQCAQRIQAGQQTPPTASLAKSFLFGGGAAFAGCVIYSTVGIVLHAEVGLISILVGYMVGKAIRHASGGLGGRPQQILAVVLTYLSISFSYLAMAVAASIHAHAGDAPPTAAGGVSAGFAVLALLLVALGGPFFSLAEGASGILTLLIVFFGLSRAWRLTGRTSILVTGPYESPAPPA